MKKILLASVTTKVSIANRPNTSDNLKKESVDHCHAHRLESTGDNGVKTVVPIRPVALMAGIVDASECIVRLMWACKLLAGIGCQMILRNHFFGAKEPIVFFSLELHTCAVLLLEPHVVSYSKSSDCYFWACHAPKKWFSQLWRFWNIWDPFLILILDMWWRFRKASSWAGPVPKPGSHNTPLLQGQTG